MFCPHCGAANAESSPQCANCGTIFLYDTPSWQAAQQGYVDLATRYERGELDDVAFQSAHVSLTVRDAMGRTWLPAADPNQPYLWDGATWAPQPVMHVAPAAQPIAAPAPLVRQPAPGGMPAYQPQSYSTQVPPVVVVQEAPKPAKRRRWGCCLWPLALLLVVAAVLVWLSPLPEQWGLRKSETEKAFGEQPEPDRGAALDLEAELEDAGVDTEGLYAYVVPYEDGRAGAVLYAVLDGSAGFRFPDSGDQDPVLAYMANLADSPALAAAGVDQIALDYRDNSGAQIMVMTAPVESIQAFTRGDISREAFFQELEVQVDLSSLGEEFTP